MKRFTELVLITLAVISLAGCKKENNGDFNRSASAGGPFNGADSVITGNISVSRTLSPGKVYKLSGIIYVINGAKLTIKPGTVITSGPAVNYKLYATGISTPISATLVITRGSSIDAAGTPTRPIVFTTPKASGLRVPGDFGGIVILGGSPTNKPSYQLFDGLPLYDAGGNSLGVDVSYGGSNSADNSGRFEYVRIEYPDVFTGLGLFDVTNLNPFYTTAVATKYSIDNLFPRDILSTKGAMNDANYSQWASGWTTFIPQTRQD